MVVATASGSMLGEMRGAMETTTMMMTTTTTMTVLVVKEEKKGIFGTRSVKWNFTKFLVDRTGVPVARYSSTTTPAAIEKDVNRLLGGAKPTGKSFVRMDDI